jgi:hypothetical protein
VDGGHPEVAQLPNNEEKRVMNSSLKNLLVATCAILLLAPLAGAEVLWDQSDFDEFGPGFFNSVSGGPPFGLTVHAVNDVTVGGPGWVVDSITTYYSALDPSWGLAITEGRLHVFPKTGPLPTQNDDPTASPTVAMSGTDAGGHLRVTASGLNLALMPGEYWIGITPVAPSGPFGPEIHLSALALVGDDTASYDEFAFPGPPAWFNFNPGVDASILIEGTFPVPVEPGTWGAIKSRFAE